MLEYIIVSDKGVNDVKDIIGTPVKMHGKACAAAH